MQAEPELDPLLRRALDAMRDGDFETSFVLTEALAKDGNARAQHFLGWHYHKGLGVPADDDKAVHWWRKAAADEVPDALLGLGWAFAEGRGVEQDPVRAYVCYNRAVALGDVQARERLFDLCQLMSPDQIRAAELDPPSV